MLKNTCKLALIFSFILHSCSSNKLELDGSWTLLYIEEEGIDISGIDKSGPAWMAKSMRIGQNSSRIIIPYFKGKLECGIEWISTQEIVFNSCSDSHFDGVYQLELDKSCVDCSYSRWNLKLYNEKHLVYAETSQTDIFKY